MDFAKAMRKWLGVIITAVAYFVVHEGAHAVYAISIGAFEKIRFLGLGVQVDINRDAMTNTQFGIFNVLGAVVTIVCGYLLLSLINKLTKSNNKIFMAIMYYLTFGFLIIDPLYLTILFQFVGGGDMNGVVYLMPQIIAQVVFGIILFVNIALLFKVIIPKYKKAFKLQ